MRPVRFELTPPKRIELESIALDHSAMNALRVIKGKENTIERLKTCEREKKKQKTKPAVGFEPTTPCLRGRCNNHYATLASQVFFSFFLSFV